MDVVTTETTHVISRSEFFEVWRIHDRKYRNSEIFKHILRAYDTAQLPESTCQQIKASISQFSTKISDRWEKSQRKLEVFMKKYGNWLSGEDLTFSIKFSDPQPSTSSSTHTQGRPVKDFEEASCKTKKRRVQDLLDTRTESELVYAAEVAVRSTGRRDAANIIKEVASSSAGEISEMKSKRKSLESQRQYTCEEALALYVDCKHTKFSYKLSRKCAISAGHYMYPSYYSLQNTKRACCPEESMLSVTESSAAIDLQAILDLTVKRLLIAQVDVVKRLLENNVHNFNLVSKWGYDGSSGHSRYKQKFSNVEGDDEFLFVFSFVPLKLHQVDDDTTLAWVNPRPASTRFCRPIKFMFHKESDVFTRSETKLVEDQINNLLPSKVIIDGKEITVRHQLLLTMVDGKVCNALTENSSNQTCYICGAKPVMMNKGVQREDNRENYSFGLSTLHAWIRTFECLLHISYKLDIKKWQVKGDLNKQSVKQRKKTIQERFKKEMGLIVDRPKPGFGSTNDGNTARRFFKNFEISADITGLSADLIQKFYVILQTLSSGYEIDIEKFQLYAAETRALYLSLYSWYYMPATVHKILVHSSNIIKHCILPIGQFSEEAQESRNKDFRRFREHSTRKRSRIATNTDLMTMRLITSDPLINSFRVVPCKSQGSLPNDVLNLLKTPHHPFSLQQPVSNINVNIDNDMYTVEESTEYESDNDSDSSE